MGRLSVRVLRGLKSQNKSLPQSNVIVSSIKVVTTVALSILSGAIFRTPLKRKRPRLTPPLPRTAATRATLRVKKVENITFTVVLLPTGDC